MQNIVCAGWLGMTKAAAIEMTTAHAHGAGHVHAIMWGEDPSVNYANELS